MSILKTAPKMGNNGKKVLVLQPSEMVKKEAIIESQNLGEPKVEKQTTEEIIKTFAPSAEERIKNADNFKILTNKFAHLKTKSDELKRFKISSDGTKEKIYLENAEGFKFEVSNSKIVEATLNLLEATLEEILSNTEKQVQEFII